MAAPHASQHASGFTRMLSVLTLIAGIAAMQVGIFTTPASAAHHPSAVAGDPFAAVTTHHAATASGAGTVLAPIPDHSVDGGRTSEKRAAIAAEPSGQASAQPADHALPPSELLVTPSAEPGCADCGDGHAGLHACVFILTALALAVLLVALYRIPGARSGDGGGSKPRHWRPRRERPPPWTVLSLAELSILRI
ncbi:hypothetical protein [Nocardia sp. NPDC050793]|uniref:hypothetical protein n=1 Tax=Nocardia sp. NPDC050793 TaxID=3155159 RepID=UPI0033E3114F